MIACEYCGRDRLPYIPGLTARTVPVPHVEPDSPEPCREGRLPTQGYIEVTADPRAHQSAVWAEDALWVEIAGAP